MGGDRFEGEVVRLEGIAAERSADPVGTEERVQAAEGFVEAVGIANSGFEELELLGFGGAGLSAQGEADDGRLGADVFEVVVEDAEEDIDIAGGRGDFEGAVVGFAGIELEGESEILDDEISEADAAGERIEEAADDKEERFERFDGIFEFEEFLVDLFGSGEVEGADLIGLGVVEKLQAVGAEAFGDFILTESEEGGNGVDAPAAEDIGKVGSGAEIFDGEGLPEFLGIADVMNGAIAGSGLEREIGRGGDADLRGEVELFEAAEELSAPKVECGGEIIGL